jgi:recombination protein RecA
MANILEMTDRTSGDKQKALDSALAQIERQFGKGSIMKLGGENDAGYRGDLDRLARPRHRAGHRRPAEGPDHRDLRAGKLGQDDADAARGGRRTEEGRHCAFVDAEHALDPQYAKKLGVDLDELLISQPDTGEQALEITDTLVRSGAVSLVVVDSVAALTPKSELEGDMGDSRSACRPA